MVQIEIFDRYKPHFSVLAIAYTRSLNHLKDRKKSYPFPEIKIKIENVQTTMLPFNLFVLDFNGLKPRLKLHGYEIHHDDHHDKNQGSEHFHFTQTAQ